MKDGGFNLQKWRSNSNNVAEETMHDSESDANKVMLESLLVEEDETNVKLIAKILSMKACEGKVLDVPWKWHRWTDPKAITFEANPSESTNANENYIENCCQHFWPTSLISPVKIPFKVYLQGLFLQQVGLDGSLSNILKN